MEADNLGRQVVAFLESVAADRHEFVQLARDNPARTLENLKRIRSWGRYYELPFETLLLCFLSGLFSDEEATSQSSDPQLAFIDRMNALFGHYTAPGTLTEDEQGHLLGIIFALAGNLDARKMFNRWLNDLVADVDKGDDEALFNAVMIDRTALQAEPIARRICAAQLAEDEGFMNRLSKAITRTRPRRPRQQLDVAGRVSPIWERGLANSWNGPNATTTTKGERPIKASPIT